MERKEVHEIPGNELVVCGNVLCGTPTPVIAPAAIQRHGIDDLVRLKTTKKNFG
jgi:hypothetical protein